MQYNNEFKEINTLEKAYILGMFQADGTLLINKRACSRCVKLKLKEEDKYLLDKISKDFSFFTEPKLEIHKNGKNYYYIYSYNRNFYEDLYNNGILPRKSYENSNKPDIPNLNDDLFLAYVHSLFDGDGSICIDKNNHIRIDLVGKTKNLFYKISERLNLIGISNKIYYRKDKDYHMIRISTKDSVKKFIEKCKNSPICLQRKFPKYFNIDWDTIPDYKSRGFKIKKFKNK